MTARRALPPPEARLVYLGRNLVAETARASRESDRKRIVQPFHRSDGELLRRMLNAIQPESYVRPHRHTLPGAVEAWLVVQGAVACFMFSDTGAVEQIVELSAGGERFGVDFSGAVFHALIALEPDTVLYEVKLGPYVPPGDTEFAAWAPAEGTPESLAYLAQLRSRFASGKAVDAAP
jgi:cupin fold WbuC family metalloprotein